MPIKVQPQPEGPGPLLKLDESLADAHLIEW